MTTLPILSVRKLEVDYTSVRGTVPAIRDVSFDLGREKLAIVGESGSGKSTLGRALVGLIPRTGSVRAECLEFKGEELQSVSRSRMLALRGRGLSMVLQDPKYSLNPTMRVGDQIAEAHRVAHGSSTSHARKKALEQLAAVHIREPELVYKKYPHEISGGMGQRVMIAMMLMPDPAVLIADEPTSALDVTVRQQVLSILDELVQEHNIGLLFISHDLTLVQSFCDRVLVMRSGEVVEELPCERIEQAEHPYTRALFASLPRIGQRRSRLPTVNRDEQGARL